jgi:hypothetical protein
MDADQNDRVTTSRGADAALPEPHPHGPAGPRLRLIRRPESVLIRWLDAVEAAYAGQTEQLLHPLEALEAALPDDPSTSARQALEQIAFIRVGLKCIADAIGELSANLTELTTAEDGDGPQPPRWGAA